MTEQYEGIDSVIVKFEFTIKFAKLARLGVAFFARFASGWQLAVATATWSYPQFLIGRHVAVVNESVCRLRCLFSARFRGFQLGDRHLYVKCFGERWQSMACLPPRLLTLWMLVEFAGSSDEDILMIKSANKTRKKAENLKFEIWFTDNRDLHMRLQIFKVSLKMLLSYFYESRSCMWRRSWDIRYDNRR